MSFFYTVIILLSLGFRLSEEEDLTKLNKTFTYSSTIWKNVMNKTIKNHNKVLDIPRIIDGDPNYFELETTQHSILLERKTRNDFLEEFLWR